MKIEKIEKIQLIEKTVNTVNTSKESKTSLARITLTPPDQKMTSKKLLPKEQSNSIQILKTTLDSKQNTDYPNTKTNSKTQITNNTSVKNSAVHTIEKKTKSSSVSEKTNKEKIPVIENENHEKKNLEEPLITSEDKPKKKAKYFSELTATGYTQELLDVKDIRNGIIRTNSNRYLMILEIFPINFYQRTDKQQKKILDNFQSFFIECPRIGQFKSIVEKTDTEAFVNHLKNVCPDTMEKHKVSIRNELINNIRTISIGNTIEYRYYFIFPYEADMQGNRSVRFEEINREMYIQKIAIKNVLERMGNLIAEPENPNLFTADVIYKILNRRSNEENTVVSRIMRINYDHRLYANSIGEKYTPNKTDVRDYLASKGTVFNHKEMVLVDGLYYTYLSIRDDGYPEELPPDWLNLIRTDPNVDIDFFYQKLPHDNTLKRLEKKTAWTNVVMNDTKSRNKRNILSEKITNTEYIIKHMKAKEDLFDCITVLTIYDTNPKNLFLRRDAIRKTLSSSGIKFEISRNDTEEYFQLTLPLCNFEGSIFNRCKRNFLTSTLRNNYMYTTFSLADPTGIPLGPNLENGTLFSPNLFNTGIFKNGSFLIIGSPGSGKSFLEMAMGRRLDINNIKCYYILPTKGYEYRDFCNDIRGSYIKLTPDSNDCLNIMELYPELDISDSLIRTEEKIEKSTLVRKITSLCAWFKLLSIKENDPTMRLSTKNIQKLNSLLVRLYDDFGFTKDNKSIWKDEEKGIKKKMPIVSTWQQYLLQDEELSIFADLLEPFTHGSFKNLDGQTNVDLSKDVIVFDIEENDVGKDLLPSISYMAFDSAQSMVKSDEENFGVIMLDEGWSMMQDDMIAEQVNGCARLIRGYGGAIGISSQNIEEFVQSPYGSGIINATETKFLLSMLDTEIDVIGPKLKLTENDRAILTNLKRGQGLFVTNGMKIKYELKVSMKELFLYTTDLNKKREFKKMIEEKKADGIIHHKE